MTGTLVISLDFELYWGVRDRCALAPIASDLVASRHVIADILALFDRRRVRATWATVGFLFFASRARLMEGLPPVRPQYDLTHYSPYGDLDAIGADEAADPFRYGLSLIDQIARCPGQEIGTHTFSHYFALEAGQTEVAFAADLRAAVSAARAAGRDVRSLVFPRNQCNEAYLPLCRQVGIDVYRGNPESWIYRARPRQEEGPILRLARLLDAYCNLSGHHTYKHPASAPSEVPLDLPASRFLRLWSRRLQRLERLRLRRIRRSMTYAAQRGEVFHLWWHPENFGRNCAENLNVLEDVLSHFETLAERYGMQSRNMGDFASAVQARAAVASLHGQRNGP